MHPTTAVIQTTILGMQPDLPTDVLFINSPIQKYTSDYNQSYQTVAPLGLGLLATICRNGGLNVGLMDAEAQHLTFDTICSLVKETKPAICGINLATPNAQLVYDLTKKLARHTKIILGGAHPTLMPHITLKECPEATAIIRGGGEKTIIPLIRAIQDCNDISKISGISYRSKDGTINHNPNEEELKNLDELPFINHEFFWNDPYHKDGYLEASIISSKGCTLNCIFCSVPTLNKRKVLFRSVKNVIHEIEILNSKYGVKSIHFMDDLFTIDRKRTEEFCNQLIESGMKIRWRALSRVDTVDKELLSLMAKAGCYKLAFGIESGTPRILSLMKKNTTIKKITETIAHCHGLGIKTKGFFTIGYPTQTKEEIFETFNFAKSLLLDSAYFTIVRAYPGTELFEWQLKDHRPESLMSFRQKKEGLSDSRLNDNERKLRIEIEKKFPEVSKSTLYAVANDVQIGDYSREELEEFLEEGIKQFYFTKAQSDVL